MATHIPAFDATEELIDNLACAAYEATAAKSGSRFTPWREASLIFRTTFRDQVNAILYELAATEREPAHSH